MIKLTTILQEIEIKSKLNVFDLKKILDYNKIEIIKHLTSLMDEEERVDINEYNFRINNNDKNKPFVDLFINDYPTGFAFTLDESNNNLNFNNYYLKIKNIIIHIGTYMPD